MRRPAVRRQPRPTVFRAPCRAVRPAVPASEAPRVPCLGVGLVRLAGRQSQRGAVAEGRAAGQCGDTQRVVQWSEAVLSAHLTRHR